MTDLEAEGIIVDEFKRRGERARARAREEVFQKYDPKLKEQEVSQVTTMTLCMMKADRN